MSNHKNLDYFVKFDMTRLNDPDFKEDSVREEIICPLLKMLGYQNDNCKTQIIRSKSLKHPWITIGSKNRDITLIPDYLLQSNSRNVFVLDAKAPSEKILSRKNIGQVYSYAIHPEINTILFSLCNGREFALFRVNDFEPLLYFQINEINLFWEKLYRILNPEILAKPEILNYFPDFGIFQKRLGVGTSSKIIFHEVHTKAISKINNDTYTCFTTYKPYADSPAFALSLDFEKKFLNSILRYCKTDYQIRISKHLENSPFQFYGTPDDDDIVFGVSAKLSPEAIQTNEETYIPFIVKDIW